MRHPYSVVAGSRHSVRSINVALVRGSIAGYVVILIVALVGSPSNTDILMMTVVGWSVTISIWCVR